MPLNPPIADWTDQRVWVVGASTGIGAAVAKALLARGARVALSARRPEPLDALAAAAPPEKALALAVDVTDALSVAEAHRALITAWGRLDVVLVVAGTYKPMRAWELDLHAARALVDVNVNGVLNVLAAVLPQLLASNEGHVGIVASVAGYGGLPQALIYGPTKAALINLAEVLYLDLAPRGIGVHLICPGFVKTPLTDGNDFHMPALISAEEAADRTLRGFERGEFETHYPKRFTRWLKVLRLLPYRLYFPLVRRITGL
ncbi:MAG: SDR family NAD(P)-dependent oxidoreductase [Burkholderiales bacterium]|nr:SDR family NAD(P)-dependent oxidoreductase [Burkholderiales bacterium]